MYNSKDNITNLIDRLEYIYYDSIVFIFGLNEGEYLEELIENICDANKVVIIEPNEKVYNKCKNLITDHRIKLVLFDYTVLKNIISKNINYENFDRLLVHSYGNYEEEFQEEYNRFIEILDNAYLTISSGLSVSYTFKEMFIKNLISNIYKVNNSTPLNSYIDINKNIPAIIVSAGPSLDYNIQTMVKYKELLDKFFIIAGNRTIGPLIENQIIPNLVVSIDAQYVTYEMIKKYIDYEIPLAFYEYSNKDLLNEYKGELIYLAELLPKINENMKHLIGTFNGGSVAHACTDIARTMGCNPIIFVGQDLAYTYERNHSKNATFSIDNNESNQTYTYVKDVYGEDIKTTMTLDFYRKKFEQYIEVFDEDENLEFYNVSYGADIKGAPHIELEELIQTLELNKTPQKLGTSKCVDINPQEIVDLIRTHVNLYLERCDECIDICEQLIKSNINIPMTLMKEDSKSLNDFKYVIDSVTDFENNLNTYYIGAYIKCFIYFIRNEYFEMLAKDYPKLTSDINYQSNCFINYFKELRVVLNEVKEILINKEDYKC